MYMYICICIYSDHNEDEDYQKTVTNSLSYFRPVGWHKLRGDACDRRFRERAERSKIRRVVLESKQDDLTQIAYDMAIESDNWKAELRNFKRSRKGGHLATPRNCPTISKKLEVLDHFEGLTNVKHREQETMNAYVGVLRSRGQIFRWREACKIQRWRDLPPDIAQKLKDNVSECLHVYIYIYIYQIYVHIEECFIYIYMQLLHTLYI